MLYALTDVPIYGPHQRYDLWLLAVDGGGPRRLTNDHAQNVGAFTPDGRSIVFSSTRGAQSHLFEMSLEGATGPMQLTFGQGWKFNPDVSPDGRSVLYDVDVTSVQLFAQPIGGGPARKFTSNLLDLKSPQPTPDGRAIIAEVLLPSLRSQIVSIPLDGGDPTPLVEGETPALTPDAREIVYSDRRSGRVMAIPRAGGASRLVTEAPGPLVHVHMGPEGRIYMMVSRPQGWEAWSAPLAGGPAERALPAPWSELVPAPRGGWRAAVQWLELPKYRVRFLAPGASLDDPSARELEARWPYAWTPDGRSWLYVGDRRVHQLVVASGEDRVISDQVVTESVAVSSDGKTLYTTQTLSHVRRELITNFAERHN